VVLAEMVRRLSCSNFAHNFWQEVHFPVPKYHPNAV
jgi:hypothetical protein